MRGLASSPSVNLDVFLDQRQVWILGVLNATPDSFYAPSRVLDIEDVLEHAETLVQEGADALDLGGESTRPGALPVSSVLEKERVLSFISEIHRRWPALAISIDTQKADVADSALRMGAALINDISALRNDPEMAAVAAEHEAPVVLMHMQGIPRTMQRSPHYKNLMDQMVAFFEERIAYAVSQGISEDRIILDPGIGFGKTINHNLLILRNLKRLRGLHRPLLLGISRKSFLAGVVSSDSKAPLPPESRLEPSLAAALWAVGQVACGLRVHDVGATRRAVTMWQALQKAL